MAGRAWKPGGMCLYKDVHKLYCVVPIGASGAVGTVTYGKGIVSVTYTATGIYTLVLKDRYKALLGCQVQLMAAAGAIRCQIISEDVDNATQASRTVVVQTVNNSGAVEPANPTTLFIELTLTSSRLT